MWKCDLQGKKLKKYPSLSEAARQINGKISTICNAAKGRRITAYGFKWVLEEKITIENEIWREIDPKHIRGLTNYWISTEGKVRNRFGRVSLGYVYSGGYIRVNVGRTEYLAHVLVAKTFLPNFFGKLRVNHKDGNKENPRLYNLEWATDSENNKHAYKKGLKGISKIIANLFL